MSPFSWQVKRWLNSPIYFVFMSSAVIFTLSVTSPSANYTVAVVFISFMVVVNSIVIGYDAGSIHETGATAFYLSHHAGDSKLQIQLLFVYMMGAATIPLVLLVFYWAPVIYRCVLVLELYSILYSMMSFSIGSLSKNSLVSILTVVAVGFLPAFLGYQILSTSALTAGVVSLSPLGGTLLSLTYGITNVMIEIVLLIVVFSIAVIYTITSGRGIR